MSDVSLLSGTSGLSFDSSFLSPLLLFCLVTYLLLDHIFLETVVQYILLRVRVFCAALVEQPQVGRWCVQLLFLYSVWSQSVIHNGQQY